MLTLRYDGTAYHGWQVQPNAPTVQQTLQDAVERVTGVRSGLIGCSRTDAGVHADMFCCTLDTDSPLRDNKLCSALNFYLPPDIAVYRAAEVAADFHPRYRARGKRYCYRIWNGAQRHPMYDRYAIHRNRPLDETELDRAAAGYVGSHDFAAFCSADSDVQGSTVRTVRRCGVERRGDAAGYGRWADPAGCLAGDPRWRRPYPGGGDRPGEGTVLTGGILRLRKGGGLWHGVRMNDRWRIAGKRMTTPGRMCGGGGKRAPGGGCCGGCWC